LISLPSITRFALVTFPIRGEAIIFAAPARVARRAAKKFNRSEAVYSISLP
jgi:hypothetical protein